MIIDLIKLKSNIEKEVKIDESLSFKEEDLKQAGILELDKAHVKGTITKNDIDNYYINIEITGTMVLPCSVSLKPTNHDFNIKIDGYLDELLENNEKVLKNNEFTIDIFPIIWENILMEIPIRIVNDDISDGKLEGEGWKFITDEKDESINPELQKLQDLLK